MTDHLGPVRTLKARLLEESAARGLECTLFGADPDAGADVVHAVFTADEDTLAAPLDQPAVDERFNEVLAGDSAAELDARAEAASAELRRRLAEGDGILG